MAPSQVGLRQGQGFGELCPSHMSVLFTAFPTSVHSEANGDSGSTGTAAKLWEVLLGAIFKKKKKSIGFSSIWTKINKQKGGKKKEFLTSLLFGHLQLSSYCLSV